MDRTLFSSLITWLRTFPGHGDLTTSSLTDGVTLGTILHQIAPEFFSEQWLAKIKTDVSDNWRLKVSNLRKIHQGVMDYFYSSELPGQAIHQFPTPDLNKIVEHEDDIEMGRLLQLILGCAINCEQKQKHIEAIMKMEERVQTLIVNAIQDLMNREASPGPSDVGGASSLSGTWLGPASFHPQMKTLLEQLESTSLAKEDMTRRCHELDLQIAVLTEEKKTAAEENEKLLERIETLESGEDIGTQSSRYKDLRQKVDALQDELYKVESARDDYRGRTDRLERENKELTVRNEDLQCLADEARALKDEVDALRDMSERVAVYEGTVETYKKKLEELSDLRRQVKILEDKNAFYMQQNMELEEEVKKSGTWRPQLDLYKKQVSDLHQKLAEETKKTDRQIFENKKMVEKLEAITQEKERVTLERDMLKENVEDLKCTVSALSSPDSTSRPPSDLSDIETLEIIPPEIREKLARLQHENRVLKQKASDKSEESGQVLESLLNDLQERHDKLLQENRWEKPSPPSSPPIYPSQWPPFGRMWPLEAYFMLDSPKSSQKLKMLRRNLKWASESDLLILRQPGHTNFMASLLPNGRTAAKRRNSSPKSLTLPTNTNTHPSHTSKENPIVIHHIHEFKMAPSPTNEDSGCCRTSPSSCEGCEDHRSTGSCGIRTPDYANTLDSGVSGMFRCLSPVIPSIVEECTTHHMSDILPAILNQEGNVTTATTSFPSVLYHTHPSHSVSIHARSNTTASKSPSETAMDAAFAKPSSTPHHNTCTSSTIHSHPLCTAGFGNDVTFDGSRTCPSDHPETKSKNTSHPILNQDSELSPQSRKHSSSLPLRPVPPGSPTPHNSPRLPHSIYSNRSKGGKVSLPVVVSVHSKMTGNEEAPNVQISPMPSSVVGSRRESWPRGNIDGLKGKTRPSESQRDSSSQTTEKPILPYEKPKPYLETDLDHVLYTRFRPRTKETPLNKLTGKLKSGIMNKVRSKSLDKDKANPDKSSIQTSPEVAPESPTKSNSSLIEPNQMEEKDESVKRISDPKPDYCTEKTRLVGRSSGSHPALQEVPREEEPKKEESVGSRKSWALNSPIYKSLREPRLLPIPSTHTDGKKRLPSDKSGHRSSTKLKDAPLTPDRGETTSPKGGQTYSSPSPLHKSSSETLLKARKKTRLLGSTKSLKGSPPSSSNEAVYAKAPLSRESLNSWHNLEMASPTKRSSSDKRPTEVTLLTDTLFTHFVVSPKRSSMSACPPTKSRSESTPSLPSAYTFPVPLLCPSRGSRTSKDNDPLLTDTDTDIELVENRLVASAFAAPLVSSESSNSILHSDPNTDMDPSATDYCSEAETEFNPGMYKLTATLYPPKRRFPHPQRPMDRGADVPDTDALIVASPHVVIRSQKKKQMTVPSKTKILSGGIVKVKKKTARAVVAETFNAMFTFCTP